MNNNKTSVEWLFQKLWDEPKDKFTWYAILKQAKEMDKEELLNIFNCGRNFQATGEGTFNEIYNEIYGSKDNIDNTVV